MNDNELLQLLSDAEHKQEQTSIGQILAALLAAYPGEWIAGQQIPTSNDTAKARELLEDQRLIKIDGRGTKPWTLTEDGVRVAQAYALESSAGGKLRRSAVQKELLKKVHRDRSTDNHPPTNDIIDHVVGWQKVTSAEHRAAVELLVTFGFLKGAAHDDGGLLRPEITTAGIQAAEGSQSPEDFYFEENRRTVKVDVNVTFAQQAEARAKVEEIKALVGKIEDVPAEVETSLAELEAVSAEPNASRSRWEAAADRVKETVYEKSADAAWNSTVAAVTSLLATLGFG